ncbi:MAG: HDIG domain-containing metalloprotein [Candidatus Acetothermia bacterium]
MKKNNRETGREKQELFTLFDLPIPLHQLVFFLLFNVVAVGLFTFKLTESKPYVSFLSWQHAMSNGLIIITIFSLSFSYLAIRQRKEFSNRRIRDFVALVVLFILLTIKGASLVSLFLAPIAFGTALVTLFVGFEAGLVLVAVLPLFVALEGGLISSIGPLIVAFAGSLVGILAAKDIRKSSDLTKIGFAVAWVNVVLIFALRFPGLSGPFLENIDWQYYSWGGFNGLIAALFLAGVVPMAEKFTQRTSPIGLMELLNPSHPLLERLRTEAPGTYHHSRNIASLGENAARAIGADPLLTAVGGHYHDIGKMVRPEFFIENQDPGVNPHDDLTPTMSKIVLTSHIKQGLELGRSYGLREDVLKFIPTHHGSSVIRYFYLKALREQREKGAELAEEEFRYEAALPRTKETSIIALADPVEAASHTLDDARGQEVEEMVEEEINDKIDEGQLDQSPLTLADIKIIKNQFVNTIRAMSQTRIENYPSAKDSEQQN